MVLPQEFISMIDAYGSPLLGGLAGALESTLPAVSVRANTRKGIAPPPGARLVPWAQSGWYLDTRPQFTFDPAIHQGLYYVQDASSMAVGAVAAALAAGQPVRYLDACAAPGGKTTAAADALPQGSLIVANEYDHRRAAVLAENMAKWGCPASVVSRGDTAKFRSLQGFFDIIAADVPCSGEGMMRKDAEAVRQWSPALVAGCAARQKEIVGNLWPALRPGGYLIYSTCTFNRQENEEMVAYMVSELDAEPVATGLPSGHGIAPGIDTPYPCRRFMPHLLQGEGLFLAVLRKPEDGDSRKGRVDGNIKGRNKPRPAATSPALLRQVAAQVSELIESPQDYTFHIDSPGDTAFAVLRQHDDAVCRLRQALDVIYGGLVVGTVKGRDLVLSQHLAMSTAFRQSALPSCEVDYPTAVSYLRREAVTLPGSVQRGYVLLTYAGHPLGFVKNMGNRSNNLYPQQWRILSTHAPATPPEVL